MFSGARRPKLDRMRRQRLGRFGPQLSLLGVRWPATGPPGVNWLMVDVADGGPMPRAPVGWAVVLLGVDTRGVGQALTWLGRDAADVVIARDAHEWPEAVALAEAGVTRCAGVVTDDPRVVERCRVLRHVDAVWSSESPAEPLLEVCRWGGAGLLQDAQLVMSNSPSPGVV